MNISGSNILPASHGRLPFIRYIEGKLSKLKKSENFYMGLKADIGICRFYWNMYVY